jgi:hypothetical protein
MGGALAEQTGKNILQREVHLQAADGRAKVGAQMG